MHKKLLILISEMLNFFILVKSYLNYFLILYENQVALLMKRKQMIMNYYYM